MLEIPYILWPLSLHPSETKGRTVILLNNFYFFVGFVKKGKTGFDLC